ncbi:MAG: alpha-amylase/4-alpha-glucanotransferase domain-containing protein, partial [Planctomycetota bacterium]
MHQPKIRLCLVLHNHQPVGNFDGVFEAAYQDSYLPFLEVFEPYEHLKISLHTSGPLATWLSHKHPEYVSRVSELVAHGRIEIVGGAFYEPILAMIPSCDRRGQITSFTSWLQNNWGGKVAGMWMPERVWESEFTSDLAESNIAYTVLDDFHFRRAGIRQEDLTGYFVTENEGHILRIFPGSEKLRYLLPFQEPGETIDYCREIADTTPGSVLVFGDDGEKFGTWPDTKAHVYESGWLRRFFDALTENRDWLSTTTLSDAVSNTISRGKIFLPDASYREMTEWAMPVGHQLEYEDLTHEFEQDPRWDKVQNYVAGGYWRNFKTKYPESNEMYSRMMYVSRLLNEARDNGANEQVLSQAQDYLYQGQCNCSYWHGAFGGIYLPHLRNAVYQNLIFADNLLEQNNRSSDSWVDCTRGDYDFDGSNEIRLANDKLVAWMAPKQGGMLYELDVRELGHNLLATIQRRPEAYHEKVKRGQQQNGEEAASIHDRVVFKQDGLENCLNYDQHMRKSLIDHFW